MPPFSNAAWWDAQTATLLRFLTLPRSHDELSAWAKARKFSALLVNMLAYLETRKRAAFNGQTWKRTS